jgi:hypothetical protein
MDELRAVTGAQIRGQLQVKALEKAMNTPVGGMTIDLRTEYYERELARKLKQAFTQGAQQGQSLQEIVKGLKGASGQNLSYLQRIVATEGHRLQEEAKMEGAKHAEAQGKTMLKMWVSMRDSSVRDAHQALDGVTIPLDAEFVSGNGGRGLMPSAMGVAADDINCRCYLDYVEAKE